jgi:hypothetical protein
MRIDEHALKASYSPKCVEIEFYEGRILGILGSSPPLAPPPISKVVILS